jgi:putative membrane protein
MSTPDLRLVDTLAIERTRMAAERTLMAWVRTALAMISFGFGIYKFIQVLQAESPATLLRAQAPRNVGLAFTGIGTIALLGLLMFGSIARSAGPFG